MANRLGETTWRELSLKHAEAVARKQEKVSMLKAMIEEWEEQEDYEHLKGLRERLRSAENQLKVMKP